MLQLVCASANLARADLAAGRDKGLSVAMLDRLTLNDKRIAAMATKFAA